jgi:hypothetical protein
MLRENLCEENMEQPSDANLADAAAINHDVVESSEERADTFAIATGHDNSSDREKVDASSEKVEGKPSVGRVRSIKNGKVRRDRILVSNASNEGKLTTFCSGCYFFFQSTQPLSFMAWILPS